MVRIICPVCRGKGHVPETFGDPKGEHLCSVRTKPCPGCDGCGIQHISDDAFVKGGGVT